MGVVKAVRAVMVGCVLFAVGLGTASAGTFYVATDGSDANPGTKEKPFATIKHAIETMAGGDTVLLRAGTYREVISYPPNGSESAYTTFKNYNGEQVIIQPATKPGAYAVYIWGRSYIRLQGLILDGSDMTYNVTDPTKGPGAGLIELGDHIVIDSCELRNLGWTNAMIGGSYCTFTNNYFHDISTDPRVGNWPGYAWYVGSGHDNLFAHNIVRHIGGWGIHNYHSGANDCRNNTYSSNVFADCGFAGTRPEGAIILSCGGGNVAVNNIIYGCGADGIWLGCGSGSAGTGDSVYNNTVYDNCKRGGRGGITIGADGCATVTNPTVINNISYQNNGKPDLYTGLYNGTLTVKNNLLGKDPRFVDSAKGDFHLKAGSPAIDAGVKVEKVTEDFAGLARPRGKGYDIGAYEYRPGSGRR